MAKDKKNREALAATETAAQPIEAQPLEQQAELTEQPLTAEPTNQVMPEPFEPLAQPATSEPVPAQEPAPATPATEAADVTASESVVASEAPKETNVDIPQVVAETLAPESAAPATPEGLKKVEVVMVSKAALFKMLVALSRNQTMFHTGQAIKARIGELFFVPGVDDQQKLWEEIRDWVEASKI